MRKVYHMVCLIVTEVGGSSPHARGLLTDGEGGTVVGRIIPVCPRMRGVYIRNPIASFTYMGSSPLARGLLGEGVVFDVNGRIIPARAGFIAAILQSHFVRRYGNLLLLIKVSNALRVSSKWARCRLLMDLLPSPQTRSMGFLLGL